MPGKEIKGRSKRANYRHGGRTGLENGGSPGKTYPSDKWKKPKTGLTLEKIEGSIQDLKDRSTKIKLRTPMGKKKLTSYNQGGKVK